MTTLKEHIQSSLKTAMRNKDKNTLKTVRMLMAAVKQREIDEQTELKDDQILAVITKMIKQRQESIRQYTQGNRPDLAEIEQSEIVILQDYLPPAMSEEEITHAVSAAIKSCNASSVRDMGKVINSLRSELQGRADMGTVSQMVKNSLS
jgi:uncharacterized protein